MRLSYGANCGQHCGVAIAGGFEINAGAGTASVGLATGPGAAVISTAGIIVAAHGSGVVIVATHDVVVASRELARLNSMNDAGGSTGGNADIPSLDGTGKVHGELPGRSTWSKYSKEDLRVLLSDLKKSVKTRTRVNNMKGVDYGHSKRLSDEHQLIKEIENSYRDHE